ncbi:ABC transporter substrate-binding protein [Streptomyces sp. NBC_00343]|uniref:ABC transporter substrate-binding protein n=1 Tax=Streptomyces sp. NBC_00343 TaxID=2975719 RepID=UPI002E27B950|nr:ABC transporter substrate-binding protein [Streptomyces sp. NBC_00343]
MSESRGGPVTRATRTPRRAARRTAAASLLAVTALLAAACTTGGATSKADTGADDTTPVTITFWHGLSSPHEIASVNAVLAKFHKKFPYITVKAVAAQTDDKVNQAIRGGTAPDVASSFNAANVGGWCSSGAFQDLTPDIKADHVDMSQIPKAVQSYTAFDGERCTMPWLADTFGLYYNKKLFAKAGITSPPKTMSELAADAKKLTTFNADGSIKTAGFMPYLGAYEMLTEHLVPSWGGKWLTADGQSNVGGDAAFAQALTWQKSLVDWFGAKKLVTFKSGMGDEFSAQNAFETGKLAMMVDGEWRNAFIKNDKADIDYGTAAVPAADGKSQLYGAGYVGGNVIGMPRGAKHPGAAWKLIKFLTTDTDALTTLADAIGNVPTTTAALDSPSLGLSKDPNFAPFLEVYKNPLTTTTPASGDGGAYLTNFGHFVEKWQSGGVSDLKAGLAAVDKQNNAALKLGQ